MRSTGGAKPCPLALSKHPKGPGNDKNHDVLPKLRKGHPPIRGHMHPLPCQPNHQTHLDSHPRARQKQGHRRRAGPAAGRHWHPQVLYGRMGLGLGVHRLLLDLHPRAGRTGGRHSLPHPERRRFPAQSHPARRPLCLSLVKRLHTPIRSNGYDPKPILTCTNMVKGREMTTTAALLCLALCAGTFTTAQATQAAEGVLEKGAPYSALFSASPESGDLIGYV